MRNKKNKYATYAEASAAARKLGFKTLREYMAGYKDDPKLSSSPQTIYIGKGWANWPDFLGTKKYAYADASAAAQRLGFKTGDEYNDGYKDDPKLPSNPQVTYAGKGWVNWYDFLGTLHPREKKYATYAEASAAAQKLGFKTGDEYDDGYKDDPKLPSMPFEIYAGKGWTDWYDFLGNERPIDKYATYAEASAAAQKLGFKKQYEYMDGYQNDSKLPRHPDRFYAGRGWKDWYDFLGTLHPREKKYATYAEASAAARKLGIKTQNEYKARYQDDPKLKSMPFEIYAGKGWTDWYDFLGNERPIDKYATYAEASAAAQRLGIKTSKEYKDGYQDDPKLPCQPYEIYAGNGWDGWRAFLGTEDETHTQYPSISAAIELYANAGTNITSKESNLKAFLREFIVVQQYIDDPGTMLSKDIPFNEQAYEAFVHSTGEMSRRPRHNICTAFLDWVLQEFCSEENDEGEVEVLPGYRNPLRTVLKGLLDQLPLNRRSETDKPPLPMDAILRAKKHLIPQGAKSFRDLYKLHPFLEDCWFEVDPALIDTNDPNCIYRLITKDRKLPGKRREEVYEMWSPVKLVANYVIFSMPLRGQQICWLDSGEGDEFIPVLREGTVKWIKNTSCLAIPKRNEGFLRKGGNPGELSAYITTNKTGLRLGGYPIPYMPDDLAYWIIQLRDWQSKYNSINALTPWSKIKLRQKVNKNILKRRGRQAFLFRDPTSIKCDEKVSPMMVPATFTRTVPALLFHSQRPGEVLAERIVKAKTAEYTSEFTPHALRVSLITAFIVDGGMPVHVISKLVGHASLVMTIYYTKVGQSQMRKELAAAEKRALEQSLDRYQDLIIQKKINEARPELIATDRNTLDQCLSSDWPAAAFQLMTIGICPMGGAKCDEGGEALIERKYTPVPNGYLGTRNCPRCRFFITGPAFLGGLSAIANEIILEINVTRKEYHELEEQREALDDERYDAVCAGLVFENERKLKKITAAYEEKAKKLDMLACDLQHLYRLITQSTELLSKTETDKHQLIVSNNYVEMGMHLAEQQSDFRLLSEVCANAEIYESASASRAQPLLSQMLDKLADTNGIAPAMFRLTEDQQLKVANQVVQLIMKTTHNDWVVADQLVNGQIFLEDLAEPLRLSDIRKEIESAMHGSMKFPLEIENCHE